MPYVEQLAERLSPRDWSIISTINRLRLVSSSQLERLHFHKLTGRSRSVKRGQVLKRLADAGVLMELPRRVGTTYRGSEEQRYALDSAGQQLARLRAIQDPSGVNVRRPRTPGERFVSHTLAVSELYVELVEAARSCSFSVKRFQAEADAYWPDGLGGWIKPDAFVWLERPMLAHYWWYEADRATESLPVVRRKLLTYLDFVNRGQRGPDDVMPWVLVGVPDDRRREAVQALADELPEPANALFRVTTMAESAQTMIRKITG
jgi:hypothetical protein